MDRTEYAAEVAALHQEAGDRNVHPGARAAWPRRAGDERHHQQQRDDTTHAQGEKCQRFGERQSQFRPDESGAPQEYEQQADARCAAASVDRRQGGGDGRTSRRVRHDLNLPAHAGRLEGQALAAPREKKFDVGELCSAVGRHFGANPEQASTNAPLQGT
jgi:hypothetical protein